MLDGAPKTPWRLRDYNPSPELLQRPKRPRKSVPSGLLPPKSEIDLAADAAGQEAGKSATVAPDDDIRAEPSAEATQHEQDDDGGHVGDYDDDDDGYV